MNATMISSSQYKDLNEFLAKHSVKSSEGSRGESFVHTHTRIPDKEHNIYPGSYVIPKEELQLFYSLYYESIWVKKRKEYLTEKQLESGGPMAVDFDFRYNNDVSTRQHTRDNVCEMVCEYSELLKECYIIRPDIPFPIFVFEKQIVKHDPLFPLIRICF